MKLNENIGNLKPSKSIVFMGRAKQLKAADSSIIDLSGGEPDFTTPSKIREEAKYWLDQGYTHYTIGPGLPELREKIAKNLSERNGCNYGPDNVIVTPGAKYAIYLSVRSVINSGDKVLYLEPGWVSYPSIIEASGGIPVPVRLKIEDGYYLNTNALEEAAKNGAKALIINYPCNPTGRILTKEEADALRAFLMKYSDIIVISDEVYDRIVFDGKQSVSMASYPELSERVITVNGFSKSVAMTGWRLGYLAAPMEIRNVIYKLYQHTLSCVSGFEMKAAAVAFDCEDEVEYMRSRYEERRNLFIGGLNSIPSVQCLMPEGAFYAWVKFDIPGYDAEKICEYILNSAKVVGVPGNAYGTDETCVRFSFAASDDDLKEAVVRIRSAIEKL